MVKCERINDPNGIVSKLVYTNFDNPAVYETVAYRYEDRGVICFSVQSGCKVGCSFCGTGKRFIRDLTHMEMLQQIEDGLHVIGNRRKIQLMSMSMGEPMDNWKELKKLITIIDAFYPEYHFYISTVGLYDEYVLEDILWFGKNKKNFGLQFSLHHWNNEKRKKLLGNYSKLLNIDEIIVFANRWSQLSGKPTYFNYICNGSETETDVGMIYRIVRGHHLTCSVLCNKNEFKEAETNSAERFANMFMKLSNVDVSVFNPAGQDTIGGGCGQLLYVQQKMKEMGMKNG